MTEAIEFSDADYADIFQIEKIAAAGGGLFEDPYPIWAELLAKAPVHKGTLAECMGFPAERTGEAFSVSGRTYYSVLGFAAASDVFTRKNDFSNLAYVEMGVPDFLGDTMLTMDGLRHRKYRNLVQEYFQPDKAANWWKGRVIEDLIDELLTSFESQESVDLNSQLFARVPLHTITKGFGLTVSEGLEFHGHMLESAQAGESQKALEARGRAGLVLQNAIQDRQARPREDLISQLAHADLEEEDGKIRKLTVEEIEAFCRLIVFGGSDTTWRQMGIALFALLNHPEQLADLIADRSLMETTILESARWYPQPLFPRRVTRDTQLHGVELPEGAHLQLCLAAANRDPSRWNDPDSFDIHRPFRRSLAFGAGAHSCLGQHVARMELTVALNAMFDRFPNMRWDPSKPPPYLTGSLIQRGPGELHVLLH
ncbi:MAG: cytochrome P450 [Novosphingobium sp.]|nr:cytochrome P450 [Novosphingobium sp.]